MATIITCFITSFLITYFAIPSVIKVASIRKIFDEPDERKQHTKTVPALGGVAIFSGIFFSILFWSNDIAFDHIRWIILPLVIIFLLGLKDDIVSIDPYKKLIGEIVAAGIIIFYGGIRIHSLHGLIGIYELSYTVSVLLTFFTIIVIINSFNLIDGIDGLAGGIGTITTLTFGSLFMYSGQYLLASISFSMAGALLAFLRYNFSPARIFMGDCGSLIVGFILSILCIKFIDIALIADGALLLPTPALALAILIIPLADTLRVFIIRISKNKSPFSADRNHIHHLLLNLGLTHKKASITLYIFNLIFIALAFLSYQVGLNFLFFLVTVTAFILTQVPYLLIQNRKDEKTTIFKSLLEKANNS